MNLQESIRRILREEDRYDDKVGKTFWFEYHCYESHESCDAELWYRSHQKVKVIGVSEWSYDDKEWRQEDGNPRVYLVEWEDGFQYDVFEDELFESPDEFYSPNPPKRKIQENIQRIREMMGLNESKKSKVTYFNWSSLKNRPEYYDYPMVKAKFKYDSLEDEQEYGVSDIQQYGHGQYFCITLNCIEHYRNNIGYKGESYFTIPNDVVIAVSNDDEIINKDKSIKEKADGFYCPTYDTYGLVVWNTDKIKKIRKPAEANRNSLSDVLKTLKFKI